jgi:hypothetical protein
MTKVTIDKTIIVFSLDDRTVKFCFSVTTFKEYDRVSKWIVDNVWEENRIEIVENNHI